MNAKWWGRSVLGLMIASQSMCAVGSAEAPVTSVRAQEMPVVSPVVTDETYLYSAQAGAIAAVMVGQAGAAGAQAGHAKIASATTQAGSASSSVAVTDRVTENQARALVQRLATLTDFVPWAQGQTMRVRTLYSPEGKVQAQLWAVLKGQEALGYLVTTLDGTQALEFSRRPVPQPPDNLQGQLLESGYVYAGPLLHLVYVRQNGALQLCNLSTGEQVPYGELQNLLPDLKESPHSTGETTAQREQTVQRSASPADDALYAVGLYGAAQNQAKKEGAAKTGVPSLQEYVQGNTWKEPAFVVFDAVRESYRFSLAVVKIAKQGRHTFVALQEPFTSETADAKAASKPPVYIDSRFGVDAIVLHRSSGK